MRRTRNQIEYEDIIQVTAEDVEADSGVVQILVAMAEQLINVLPVSAD